MLPLFLVCSYVAVVLCVFISVVVAMCGVFRGGIGGGVIAVVGLLCLSIVLMISGKG